MALADALQAIIAGQLRQRVPGLSMAVIQGGQLQWAQGFGLADLETRRPADADDLSVVLNAQDRHRHGGNAAGRPWTARPGRRCR
jgi:CubicO group peptidase (beta-lactamase class C family)